MAFFPRNLYNSDASFTPLFRLLDDFDNYSRQSGSPNGGRRTAIPTFQPKFDVRETGEAYELHGELPGMVRENVNIEFTEPQTMVVRGKVERTYTAGTPPAGHPEGIAMSGAITEGGENTERHNSHKATVEDENEAQVAETPKTDEKKVEKQPADKAKYWLSERSIGEFSRSFNFPTRVDQDSVSASLKDGILTVTVPKAKKHEARRIAIS